MKYLVLIYGSEKKWADITPDQLKQVMAAWDVYSKALADAGVLRAGAALHGVSAATTVRAPDGRVTTTDGPFAETKEQLAGFYLIDVPSLDDAIKWAGRCPGAAVGSIELRPVSVDTRPDGTHEYLVPAGGA